MKKESYTKLFSFLSLDKCEPVYSDGTVSSHLERMDGRKKQHMPNWRRVSNVH